MAHISLKVLAAGALVAMGAAACASLTPPAQGAPRVCYWLSNQGAGWVAMPHITTRDGCFAADSCSGGLGHSGGGCYKWTVGPNDPFHRW